MRIVTFTDRNVTYHIKTDNTNDPEAYEYFVVYNNNGKLVASVKTSQTWKEYGVLHRQDGPAYIDSDLNIECWFYDGIDMCCETQEEFNQLLRMRPFW